MLFGRIFGGGEKAGGIRRGGCVRTSFLFRELWRSVVEAVASGLPVIISDQVGIHHEVAQAKAGLVVRCE